jgi:hypothetical protein
MERNAREEGNGVWAFDVGPMKIGSSRLILTQ